MTTSNRPKRLFGRLLLLATLALPSLPALAQTVPTDAAYDLQGQSDGRASTRICRSSMFAIGTSDMLDTYLSAEKYKGSQLRYICEVQKTTRLKNVEQTLLTEGLLDNVNNRADNNDEMGGLFNFEYHLRGRWHLSPTLTLEAGGGIGTRLGFLYNTRNSNNPAQAYASLQLLPSAAATKHLRLFARNAFLRYEISAPIVGLMFSPNYGQSYYEIFSLGNYDRNIVPTTVANAPSLRHMLTFDFQLRKRKPLSTLRIGYLGDYQQAEVNHLKQHRYNHMFVIGFTKRFNLPKL